tara:strand:+ start:334 stop:909 length:576 start_codon:yes stop_codon:yes gene_type:complete
MVKLDRIYTGGGDAGATSLGNGERVAKSNIRVQAYGTVDEVNAIVGLVQAHLNDQSLETQLARIQNDLFDLGADLCTPQGKERKTGALRMTDEQWQRLEEDIDVVNDGLEPLTSFVLPGGSMVAAHLHLARTVVRRAERIVCELAEREKVSEAALKYLNRLSDFFFVLSRHCNDRGNTDVLWVPGGNQSKT